MATKLFAFAEEDEATRLKTYEWTCRIRVSIAVHSEKEEDISEYDAAVATADVANLAVPLVSNSQPDWKGLAALFCSRLRDTMQSEFDHGMFRGYGARVNQ